MRRRELEALEHDVAESRRRLGDEIARLRSPAARAGFKDDILAQARAGKDEMMLKVETAAKGALQRAAADLKARAAAHPVAALAVAAGLTWHLTRRPPVATTLIALGLLGLYGRRPAPRLEPGAAEMLEATQAKVKNLAAQAIDKSKDAIGDLAEATAERARVVLPARPGRHAVLLGAAAVAMGGALSLAFAKRRKPTAAAPRTRRKRPTRAAPRGRRAATA